MDLRLTPEQQLVRQTAEGMAASAAAARGVEITQPEYDGRLEQQLRIAGFTDCTGLDAALIIEALAIEATGVPLATFALVSGSIPQEYRQGSMTLALDTLGVPTRYVGRSEQVVVLDRSDARTFQTADCVVQPCKSDVGYPLGRLVEMHGRPVWEGAAAPVRRGWRVALAAEAAGLMHGALRATVRYVTERQQFGRSIGSNQAIQHRLAELAVAVEGSRWLAYEAATTGDHHAAAAAIAFALRAATAVSRECHQLTGAMGLTREYDLWKWTGRMRCLTAESGSASDHEASVWESRWSAAAGS